jgi:hypothetical protein
MRLHRAVPVAPATVLRREAVKVTQDQDDGGGVHAAFVPVQRLSGSTGGELFGEWLARVLAIPAAQNPIAAPANRPLCLEVGRHRSVLAPTGVATEITCTMPVGMRLLVVGDGSRCSSAEATPYHGVTEAEQHACAIETIPLNGVSAFKVSLDGGAVIDIHQDRFLTVTPQLHTIFPADPVLPATPGPATFVGAGYVATVPRRALAPGPHVINGEIVLTHGGPEHFSIIVNVVGRSRGHA